MKLPRGVHIRALAASSALLFAACASAPTRETALEQTVPLTAPVLAPGVDANSDKLFVVVTFSGGGKRAAAVRLVQGKRQLMRLQRGLGVMYRKYRSRLVRTGFINGLPGFVTREADGELQTTALDIEDGKITAIYVMRNPDKLKHLH